MDVVFYDSKKMIKEIYQVLIFGRNGLHWLVMTTSYIIVKEQLFKHSQDTTITPRTTMSIANDTFHDVHVKQ
jgi:hypothetical protein